MRRGYNRVVRRTHRIAVAFATLAALLFTQLAVASYACPKLADGSMAAMHTPCDEVAPAGNANLCERHCEYGAASLDKATAVVALPSVVELAWRPGLEPGELALASPPPRTQDSWRPPPQRVFVLRI